MKLFYLETVATLLYLCDSVYLADVENGRELVLIQILYRHGDRSPVNSYPNDLHNESSWPQGFGQLTTEGMKQHYALGQYLRKRYIEGKPYSILSERYDHSQVKVRSTDWDRTLMSAYSDLAGLFPPNGSQVWDDEILWQPIPVHTEPRELDYVLNTDTRCPKYTQRLDEVYSEAWIKKEERENRKFYEFIDSVTGIQHAGIRNVWYIYDILFCESNHGLQLPDWVNDTWNGTTTFDKLRILHDLSFTIEFDQPELRRLRGGPLLGAMIDNMKQARNASSPQRAFIYSAHDSTVSALLSAMEVFNKVAPPYACAVLVELFRDDVSGQYTVEVWYRNDSRVEPYQLTVPDCGEVCTLDKFIEVTDTNVPVDWHAECQTTSAVLLTHNVWFVVSLTLMSCLVIVLLVVCLLAVRRCQHVQYHYQPLYVN